MKKLLIPLLCLLLLLPHFAAADTAEPRILSGMITDITEDGFALLTDEGILYAAVSGETEWDVDRMPLTGDTVSILFTGPLDRKMLHAVWVQCHFLSGTTAQIDPFAHTFLLHTDAYPGGVLVRYAGSGFPEAEGQPLTVYYNGAMTRSIPPQINALALRGLTLTGTVQDTQRADDEFLLLTDTGEEAFIRPRDDAAVLAVLTPGNRVRVIVGSTATLSLPPVYEAHFILPCTDASVVPDTLPETTAP